MVSIYSNIVVSVGKLQKRSECLNFLLCDEDLCTKKICGKVLLSCAFFVGVCL